MKVRYAVRCARCLNEMRPGDSGVRFHGHIWHPDCYRKYVNKRETLRLAATTGG